MKLAFCIFGNDIHLAASNIGQMIIPFNLKDNFFQKIQPFLNGPYTQIITSAGPMPFTQLRVLRSIQLGLASGWDAPETLLVNMFDVLSEPIEEYAILLKSNRGDYFGRSIKNDQILDEKMMTQIPNTIPIVSDDTSIATISPKENLAQKMIDNIYPYHDDMYYMIELDYKRAQKINP